jgi:hypothetical protein
MNVMTAKEIAIESLKSTERRAATDTGYFLS